MKHNDSTLSTLTWKLAVISLLLSLYACAGEETSSPATTQAGSTLLADNKLPAELDFANFKHTTFYLDPSSLSFQGSKLFLKLSRIGNEVLYLGEIDRYLVFSIAVQIRLDDTQLFYEIFSNDVEDPGQFGVINL